MSIPNKSRALLLTDIRKVELVDVEVPKIVNSTDVLIHIKAVGICGGDINYFLHGGSTFAKIKYPHALGHEAAGIIEAIGSDVKDFKVGDRVAIEPGIPCGKCKLCMEGKYNLCKELSFMGIPVYLPYSEGAFNEYVVRPANRQLFKLPDDISFEVGAMLEPLSVGIQAVKQAHAKQGDVVLVNGCGPISICVLFALKAIGVHDVFMTDIDEHRIAIAEELGAIKAFKILDEDAKKTIMDRSNGFGLDVVLDTTEYMPLVNESINLLAKGGQVVMISVPHSNYIKLNYRELFMRQASLNTSFRYVNTYESAIRLVRAGVIPLEKLITHVFPVEKGQEAFELVIDRKIPVLKTCIIF